MNEEAAFHQTIAQNPHEDMPWLAYADWLDEHGRHGPAARIRWWVGAKHAMAAGRSWTGFKRFPVGDPSGQTATDQAERSLPKPDWLRRLSIVEHLRHQMERYPPGEPNEAYAKNLLNGLELHALGLRDAPPLSGSAPSLTERDRDNENLQEGVHGLIHPNFYPWETLHSIVYQPAQHYIKHNRAAHTQQDIEDQRFAASHAVKTANEALQKHMKEFPPPEEPVKLARQESWDWVHKKVKKLIDEGKPHKQAIAIALNMAGRSNRG